MEHEGTGALVPVEQKAVDFYGTELIALRDDQGQVWVPLRHLCDAIGVTYHRQLERIQEDAVMREQLRRAPLQLADGRTFEMECLVLKYVRGWLFSINANRVKPEVRERLIQYQREVYEVIDQAFSRTRATVAPDETILLLIRENAAQVVQLADTVLAEQRRLRAVEGWVGDLEEQVTDHSRQLRGLVEAFDRLRQDQGVIVAQFRDITRILPAPTDAIGPTEQAAIKALVDDLVAAAQERGIRLGQGRNDYPYVWDAFKRRFDVAKYQQLSRSQYGEALQWLTAWRDRILAGSP